MANPGSLTELLQAPSLRSSVSNEFYFTGEAIKQQQTH
jgi:hypothetical protein